MEGRSKSRFPEKCKSRIWGRFPSQCWPHFGAMFAPKMHCFAKKKLLEISKKKGYPPSLKQLPTAKPDGSRKPPSRTRFFKQETVVWAIVGHCSGFVEKNRRRCHKSETVGEKLLKIAKGCWRICRKLLREDTVLVIWHARGKGPANFMYSVTQLLATVTKFRSL